MPVAGAHCCYRLLVPIAVAAVKAAVITVVVATTHRCCCCQYLLPLLIVIAGAIALADTFDMDVTAAVTKAVIIPP